MSKVVVFNFEPGSFEEGFPVTLRIEENKQLLTEIKGKIPPTGSIKIFKLYETWQKAYKNLSYGNTNRIKKGTTKTGNTKDSLPDCGEAAKEFRNNFRSWLKSDSGDGSFLRLRERLIGTLGNSKEEEIRVLIQTDNQELKKLPWLEWDIFQDQYPEAEIALASTNFSYVKLPEISKKEKVNILTILGDDSGIDISEDLKAIKSLPDANIVILEKPEPREVIHQLLKSNWDILFFSGHSSSEQNYATGKINLRENVSIEIRELKQVLFKAINNGLQIAIFNSCDGLGLANILASLNMPQMIVMRENVQDIIAQVFLKYFLENYGKGNSFYQSVWKARNILKNIELYPIEIAPNHRIIIPGATWLPVIYQNPAVSSPPTWQELLEGRKDDATKNLELYRKKLINNLQKLQSLKVETKELEHSFKNVACQLSYVTKIPNFDMTIDPAQFFNMSGDALFIVSEFTSLTSSEFIHYSNRCFEFAKKQKSEGTWYQQIMRLRIPYTICFSIALVPKISSATQEYITRTNPGSYNSAIYEEGVDLFSYFVPVVYVAEENKIYFFNEPSWIEFFNGEAAWKCIRVVIEKYLTP